MREFPQTITAIQAGLAQGDFTALELTQAIFDRIDLVDNKIEGFLALNQEEALEAAKAADERGYGQDAPALNGVPIALKDNILTKDLTTTAASKMLEGFQPSLDATVVTKLREAGAVIIGKTNMDEFAMGSSTETSYYKQTKNAWGLDRVPGGSSGGSAAVVASRQVPASLGSDTGGSIRQPAAFNGLVGMKPTYGAVSRLGVVAMASSLDQVGPMTLTVEDNAKLLEVIAGHDEGDMTSLPDLDTAYSARIGQSIEGLRIAVPRAFSQDALQADIKQALEAAVEFFKSRGAIVEEVDFDHLEHAPVVYGIISSTEAAANLQRFDGIRYGYRSPDAKSVEEIYVMSRSEGFGEEVKRRIVQGTFFVSEDAYDDYFYKATQMRTIFNDQLAGILDNYDLILGPTTATTAYEFGGNYGQAAADLSDSLVVIANFAGIPAISFPAGFDQAGLPFGLQLLGAPETEALLYQVAYDYESNHDFVNQAPEL